MPGGIQLQTDQRPKRNPKNKRVRDKQLPWKSVKRSPEDEIHDGDGGRRVLSTGRERERDELIYLLQ